MRAWDLHDNCMTCSFQKCRCAHRICLNTNYQLSTNCYYTVTFMLQPAKMHGGARNCYKRRYSALHAQLCTLRAQDQLENLTNCPLLIATHSDLCFNPLKCKGKPEIAKRGILARFARDCAHCTRRISLKI